MFRRLAVLSGAHKVRQSCETMNNKWKLNHGFYVKCVSDYLVETYELLMSSCIIILCKAYEENYFIDFTDCDVRVAWEFNDTMRLELGDATRIPESTVMNQSSALYSLLFGAWFQAFAIYLDYESFLIKLL